MSKKRIIVIGAGAAGLMAAGQAAEAGADVLVLEKMQRPGRKLSITGKGRCNLTNIAELDSFIDHFGKTGRFLRYAFSQYFTPDLMSFLAKQGLPLVTERGGRVFPASGKAPDVTNTLLTWNKSLGVTINCASPVSKIVTENSRAANVIASGKTYPCDAVILATGGASYPATGSTGDGYKLAEAAGHTIVPIRPALVPLETAGGIAGRMDTLNLKNVKVSMFIDTRKHREAFGELVFTKTGVTGPVILTLSSDAVDAIRADRKVTLSIDLKPALDEKKLDARLQRDLESRAKENFGSFLRGLMAKQMVPVCANLTKIPLKLAVSQITGSDIKRLRSWLKDFQLEVTGYRPFDEAIVTAGGVSTAEIKPETMESLKTKGLYIAGELLDVNADTGGYNLQAAFSTGWLAGRSATLRGI